MKRVHWVIYSLVSVLLTTSVCCVLFDFNLDRMLLTAVSSIHTMYSKYPRYFQQENPRGPIASVSNSVLHRSHLNYQQQHQRQHPISSNLGNNNILFSKLNLYEEVKVLIKPDRINPRVIKNLDMKVIVPYLTTTTTDDDDERYCVMIRFCKYSRNVREQADRLPKEFTLVINQTAFQIRNKYTYTPYDITSCVLSERQKQSHKRSLTFKIFLNPDDEDSRPIKDFYYYGVFLMKKLDHKMALANCIAKAPLDLDVSLDIVKQTLNTDEIEIVDDLDLQQQQIKLSLLCPISATKMKHPARSINCKHVHCFDAESFITINATTPRWKCPVCMNLIKLDDLIIDSLISKILGAAPSEVTEAIIFEDGSFEYIQDNAQQRQQTTTNSAVANSSLPSSSSQSASSSSSGKNSKRKIEEVQIEYITIDSDVDDDGDDDENKSDWSYSSIHHSQEDPDSDIEIVFEKIVPRKKSNSRLATATD